MEKQFIAYNDRIRAGFLSGPQLKNTWMGIAGIIVGFDQFYWCFEDFVSFGAKWSLKSYMS